MGDKSISIRIAVIVEKNSGELIANSLDLESFNTYEEISDTDVRQIVILKDLPLSLTSSSQVTDVIKEKHLQITYTTKANEKRTALVNYEKRSTRVGATFLFL